MFPNRETTSEAKHMILLFHLPERPQEAQNSLFFSSFSTEPEAVHTWVWRLVECFHSVG